MKPLFIKRSYVKIPKISSCFEYEASFYKEIICKDSEDIFLLWLVILLLTASAFLHLWGRGVKGWSALTPVLVYTVSLTLGGVMVRYVTGLGHTTWCAGGGPPDTSFT